MTITDFATGEAGKEVILLVGGEHARELITSEIVYWLGKLLAGNCFTLILLHTADLRCCTPGGQNSVSCHKLLMCRE